MTKQVSFLVFLILAILVVGCGDTKTLSLSYVDSTASANPPNFVVYVGSDMASNFYEALSPRVNSSGQTVYYYTGNTINIKNCPLYEALVDNTAGYHTGTYSVQNCTPGLSTSLRTEGLFPVPATELAESGKALTITTNGFVYAYFFYNPNPSVSGYTGGFDVAAGSVVPTGNRCFKLWAAKVVSGQLISAGGGASPNIDLKALTCYGF